MVESSKEDAMIPRSYGLLELSLLLRLLLTPGGTFTEYQLPNFNSWSLTTWSNVRRAFSGGLTRTLASRAALAASLCSISCMQSLSFIPPRPPGAEPELMDARPAEMQIALAGKVSQLKRDDDQSRQYVHSHQHPLQ